MKNLTMTPREASQPEPEKSESGIVRGHAKSPARPELDPAVRKKIEDFHANQRNLSREVVRRCKAGKEKRPQVCARAQRVMLTAPAEKNSAGK